MRRLLTYGAILLALGISSCSGAPRVPENNLPSAHPTFRDTVYTKTIKT